MKYAYSGPVSGVTLKTGSDIREVILTPGAIIDLPEKNEYVATLVARGHLLPVPDTQRVVKPSAKGK